jgi:hypothetical protein
MSTRPYHFGTPMENVRSMNSDYWLLEWIELKDIKTPGDALRALGGEGYRELLETAERSLDATRPQPSSRAVVAGRTLDLSGKVTCIAPPCLKRQVDELLVRVWHYFDEVVVEGLSADLLVQTAKVEPAVDEVAVRVLSQVELLLYLREIGALDLLVFREKPHAFCADHFRQHAEELGIPAALDDALADEVVDYFAKTSTLEITEAEGERFLWFTHPDLDAGWALSMPSDRGEPDKRAIAARAFAQQCMALVSDVGQARNLRLPLTTVGHSLIRREASELDETSVALALNLPIVQGLGAKDLLQLIREHPHEFEAFRHAVTMAIREQVAGREADPAVVAERVRRDFIDPALADIHRRLEVATRALGRKMAQNALIGAAATSVGFLTGVPLVWGGGIAMVGSSIRHLNKFAEEEKDVELSDLYFLWRLEKRGLHAH